MGWLNFHSKLVREVKRADENEVCKHSAVSLVLFLYLCMLICAFLTSQPDPHCLMSLLTYCETREVQQCHHGLSASGSLLSSRQSP